MDSAHGLRWREDVLSGPAKDALRYLADCSWLQESGWYLAGGTALALQAGHRKSVDLDFFTQVSFEDVTPLRRRLPGEPDFAVDKESPGTLYGRLHGAKVSFISYPFFLPREAFLSYGSVQVLSERDIAVMKIVAVSQRGKKRDFLDLYWYFKNRESIVDVCLRLPGQYPTVAHNYQHVLKALMYFSDADDDVMPTTFFEADWRKVKEWFAREVPRAAKALLRIG